MTAYYNEFKPEAAHMLRQLIKDGLIAPGDVDERSITEVKADDIRKYTQCHFFAGIGGWSVALRLAGWDDSRKVWTGSCPCQPFSTAGKHKGKEDERHLWPVWFGLIRESKPLVAFGEQVPAAISHGWWDDVADDLEGEGYTTRAEIRPACSVGRPHQRKRLWFVGHSAESASEWRAGGVSSTQAGQCGAGQQHGDLPERLEHAGEIGSSTLGNAESEQVVAAESRGLYAESGSASRGEPSNVADSERGGRQGQGEMGEPLHTAACGDGEASESFDDSASLGWIACPDGKSRPVVRDFRSVVDGLHNGTLRFDENSINQSQKEVRIYAKTTQQRPRDILQALRDTITSQTVWQKPRGFFGICEAEILLPYLLQLEGCENESGTPREVEETSWESLRGVWLHSLSSCPPQGWGLHEQSSRQHSDALHLLSWLLARSARQAFEAMLRDASPIGLLAHGVQHRAPILHAFGNAIVPEVAAEFIKAAM